MSDTPLTDANAKLVYLHNCSGGSPLADAEDGMSIYCHTDLARNLERKLTAANAKLELAGKWGMEFGMLKSSDCPEAKLAVTFREDSELSKGMRYPVLEVYLAKAEKDLETANVRVKELERWKNTVLDNLICLHIYQAEHDSDPKKAMHDAINWNVEIALDPAVSKDAFDLVRTAKADALEEAAEIVRVSYEYGKHNYIAAIRARAASIREGKG